MTPIDFVKILIYKRTVEGKTRRALVRLLKSEGAMNSARLARRLKLTPMAVRQHLYQLQNQKLVTAEERRVPLGRPAKFWTLTREADRLFPDAYAELSVSLLNAVGVALGSGDVEKVLASRCAAQRNAYAKRIDPSAPLEKKLRELAKIRTEEGYMAEVHRDRDGYVFIENHCPICAAAQACQGFCSTELELFRSVLGPGTSIGRAEHIISGDRRCVYRIAA